MKVISKGRVMEHPSAPATLILETRHGRVWPIPTWAWKRGYVRVGQTLIISVEEPEKENVKSQDNPDL